MKIETKYNLGDEVWVNVKGKPTKGKVQRIQIRIGMLFGTEIYYDVLWSELPYREGFVFSSEEELRKFFRI